MEPAGTIGELFELAVAAEIKAGEFYAGLAVQFAYHDEVARFWRDMQAEEAEHLRLLKSMKAKLTDAELLRPVEQPILWKARRILQIEASDLLDEVQTLQDAYDIAHELEGSEINAVFAFIMNKFLPPAERKAFVISELREHQQKLVDFNQRFGDVAWRKSINALT